MNYALSGLLSLAMCVCALAGGPPQPVRIVKVLHDTEPQRHDSTLVREIGLNEVGKFQNLRDNFAPKPAGEYITAIWRSRSREPLRHVTVRLFYRQARVAQAQVATIPMEQVKAGTTFSSFQVIGDAYAQGGPITAWKIVVADDGGLLDSFHSFLWKDPS